jgi:hypothetical protein
MEIKRFRQILTYDILEPIIQIFVTWSNSQLLIGVDIRYFFRVDACQLVNSKLEIKRFRQILTYDILEPQRRYAIK